MMQTQNMQAELHKLAEIAPQPLNISFPLGYLSSLLPLDVVITLRNCFIDLIKHVSTREVLKILLYIKEILIPSLKKGEEMQIHTKLQAIVSWTIFQKDISSNSYKLLQLKPKQRQKIECQICARDIAQKDICSFSCRHTFHKACFQRYSQERIFTKNLPIRCPKEECEVELPFQQISKFISRELQEKLNEFMFQLYVEQKVNDTSWCPTPGCQVVFQNQDNLQEFRCPSCRHRYCLQCNKQFHGNMSCQKNKELLSNLQADCDRIFIQLANKLQFKQCPCCLFWVERIEGCDHMTCRCQYEFCYVCGGQYNNCECRAERQYDEEAASQGSYPEEQYQPEDNVSYGDQYMGYQEYFEGYTQYGEYFGEDVGQTNEEEYEQEDW